MPGFNPGSCNEPDVKSTSTVTVTSQSYNEIGINSGGQSPCGDDPCENIRDTDGDQWADIAQTVLRPSCHPCSSDSKISPPDVSLTLPVSSSPPPTPVPPPCVDPRPKIVGGKSVVVYNEFLKLTEQAQNVYNVHEQASFLFERGRTSVEIH
ncbi:hypothetical protein BT96DRAFT_992336 [Gymnopus androsaceus JB14]|uniref:Uncharacterized protein n=1 Tax=Gymnopus androsaceus JB14 TaxID=1447944 RepID=A0A6A4HX32_9AGAR|nr:hypothetical protein BT96DRAFT_992336 [Gymnopus androsaceus JB14]